MTRTSLGDVLVVLAALTVVVSAAMVPVSGHGLTAVSMEVVAGFEDGTLDGWYLDEGSGSITASDTRARNGSYSLKISDTTSSDSTARLPDAVDDPAELSFYVYPTSNTADAPDARFKLEDASNTTAIWLGANGPSNADTWSVREPGGFTDLLSMNYDAWNKIEFKNIDYTNQTYDVWIDGTEQATGVAFYESASGGTDLITDESDKTGESYWDTFERAAVATSSSSTGVSQTFGYRDLDSTHEWDDQVRYSLWEQTDSGQWVHLGARDENWNGRATFQGLEADGSHRIQLLHQQEAAMHEVVGFEPGYQPSPWTIAIAPDGTASSSSPTATGTGTGTQAPTDCPAGTIQTGTDESGSTGVVLCGDSDAGDGFQQIDFDFEGPDGETWEYNQTFPDPPEWYAGNYTQNATNISDPGDWALNYSVQDENGTWYNGTTGLDGGENFLTGESLSGGPGPMGGGDTTLPPLAIWASMAAAAAGFYYRRPGRRAALAESLRRQP